jgi:hypothetical protein
MKSCVLLLATIVVFTFSSISIAADVYINGGTHTFNDAMYENDSVYLGDDGPFLTQAVLIEGGVIGQLVANGFSTVEIGGVTPQEYIPGGYIKENLIVNESANVSIYGGSIGNTIEVFQNGTVTLFGIDFKVTDPNGVAANIPPYIDTIKNVATLVSEEGQTSYYTGIITGTLADGSILNNTFKIYDSEYSGDIRIRPRPMAYRIALAAMSQERTGLLLKNNSNLTIIDNDSDNIIEGNIVNSSADGAVLVQGKASIDAYSLNIAGTLEIKGSLSYPEGMSINENLGIDPIPDPFILDEPDYADLPDLCPVNPNTGKVLPLLITEGQAVVEPGYYSAGIIIQDATVTCLPGIYHLGGGTNANSGLILKGASVVDANEVMFHLVENGVVSISNNAILTATAPTSGDYAKLLFFQSRDNTSTSVFRGTAQCSGVLYFLANHVEIAGDVLCSMLMADTIELSSNAELTVNPSYLSSE